MKGNDTNWGGWFCMSSGFFAIMTVISHSLLNGANSGIYALISLALASIAIPLVLKVDVVEIT